MFEITDSAVKQFLASAKTIGDDGLSLRIAARKSPMQTEMLYQMGFDHPKDDDVSYTINGIKVVIDSASVENVKAMIIDFRELDGLEQFVFINPNDKKNSCETSPSGCDPEGNTSCKSCQEDH
jgi:iron-sulfur cluster assembly protein